jgi:hypothetical protein
MLTELATIFAREIDGLRAEIEHYPDDEALWREVPGCPNSGGTLALHMLGNLRHFIGAQLGNTRYVRQRDAEFSTRGLPRSEVLALVAAAGREVGQALSALDPDVLSRPCALPSSGTSITTGLWLLHLGSHLAFHLGQLDYHRRAATGIRTSAGAVAIQALVSPPRF